MKNLNKLPDNWELVLLGYFKGSVEKEKLVKSYLRHRKKITDKHKLVRLTEIASGAHGYIINLKGAKKLIEALKTIHLPIDHYTGDDKYTNLYAVFPRVIRVDDFFAKKQSSLELERNQIMAKFNTNSKKFTYKFKREILRLFQKLVRFLKPLRRYT